MRRARRNLALGQASQVVGEAVIDVPVMGFVSPHNENHVAQSRIQRQVPVTDGDLRRSDVGGTPFVDLGQVMGIADHRLFLEIAHETMRGLRRENVETEEEHIEQPLGADDHEALEGGRLAHLDEGHQVHALVFSFVHQRADPASVVFHPAQALQVVEGRADHAGHRGHGLQHHGPMTVAFGEKGVGEQPQEFGHAEREAVRGVARLEMDGQVGLRALRQADSGAKRGGRHRTNSCASLEQPSRVQKL